MFTTELHTFVRKFHQLWKDGVTAHLDLDTHAGNAWVGLRVQLGHVPGPSHQQVQPVPQQVHRKFESLSWQRRRARREAARAEKNKNTEAVEAEEIGNENITIGGEVVNVVAEMHEEGVDGKVSQVAAEVTSSDKTDNLEDALCSDEEYNKQQKVTGSAIPQFDGTYDEEVVYTFISDFHKEDIEYTLKEVIPVDIETKIVSVVRIGGLQSADQLCTLAVKLPPEKNFSWPVMSKSQSEVIKNPRTVLHFDPA